MWHWSRAKWKREMESRLIKSGMGLRLIISSPDWPTLGNRMQLTPECERVIFTHRHWMSVQFEVEPAVLLFAVLPSLLPSWRGCWPRSPDTMRELSSPPSSRSRWDPVHALTRRRRPLLLSPIPRRWDKRPLTTGAPPPAVSALDPPVAFWLEVQLSRGKKMIKLSLFCQICSDFRWKLRLNMWMYL